MSRLPGVKLTPGLRRDCERRAGSEFTLREFHY